MKLAIYAKKILKCTNMQWQFLCIIHLHRSIFMQELSLKDSNTRNRIASNDFA
uniref:Uncharacterized protein n=1 Tax=Arundo donax TaxID=35708 RepID=A0A0A9E0D2_ARUDO